MWVALLGALLLAGCSSPAASGPEPEPVSPSASAKPEQPAAELAAFYEQRLAWKDCRSGDQCATLTVPLDYAQPQGRTLQLQVLRVPAKDQEHKVGSLVVNPGGPGGSGIEFATRGASTWGEPVLKYFDVVGFDPRGVGSSDPLQCWDTKQLDTWIASDPDPDTAAEWATYQGLSKSFFDACMAKDPGLATHMSTAEVARDMDVLRGALGEQRLNYFGASYGTYIGATYAGLFPGRVGRFVLDGAIDPSLSGIDMSVQQAGGFEVALRAYVGACVDKGSCFLGSTVDAGVARIQQLFATLDANPIRTKSGRLLTEGLAMYGVIIPLYSKDYWSLLDVALKAALNGSGDTLLTLSDAYASRGPSGYLDNSYQVLPIVNCTDHDDYVPYDQIDSYVARFLQVSPTFGRFFADGLAQCGDWSFRSGQQAAPASAPGAAPIVVLGTTRDPATPIAWAQALASQLSSGVLVTRDGDGHTAYTSGNRCIDDAVQAYLVSGTVPAKGTTC